MTNEEKNREIYVSAFDRVHTSDELKRKVLKLTETREKKKHPVLKKVVCIVAAVVLLCVLSNVIVFAATGETWVEKILVHVIIDGESKDLEMSKTVDENGGISYEAEFDDDDKKSYYISLEGDAEIKDGDTFVFDYATADDAKVVEENGRTYLCLTMEDFGVKDFTEDITDDFADGSATVTIHSENGATINITVEGTVDGYSISCDVEEQ